MTIRPRKTALVVAGPTCSGKSALALHLAQHLGGVVINADSMQVYGELLVLTARPTAAEMQGVQHILYGARPAAEPSTVAWWREAALAAMAAAHDTGCVPILCGGTGMYLAALAQGLADIPDPGMHARAEARALLAQYGPAALHARLAAVDPGSAAALRPTDSQRLARAWEVWAGTGVGMSDWKARQAAPLSEWELHAFVLDPPRAELRSAIAARFASMLRNGAVEEVRALLDLRLDPALPVLRAHGVPELALYLAGGTSLQEAAHCAVTATRQYARRQATWFRHRSVSSSDGSAEGTLTHRFLAQYASHTQLPGIMKGNIANFRSTLT